MTVTVEKLARAIERRLSVEPARARAMAQRVLTYFGFETTIIDNMIDPEDRRLFYELHDAGLLRSSLDTAVLPSGKNWRIFYWELDEKTLDDLSKRNRGDGEDGLYDELPAEAWRPRATAS